MTGLAEYFKDEHTILIFAISCVVMILGGLGFWFWAKLKLRAKAQYEKLDQGPGAKKDPILDELLDKIEDGITSDWKTRLSVGLKKSRSEIFGGMARLLGRGELSNEIIDEIEELLYAADLGPGIVSELLEALKKQITKGEMNVETFKELLFKKLFDKISPVQSKADLFLFDKVKPRKLKVIMIVGVNGAGKTTTIGKLATKLTHEGAKVVVGACDTFRAAAVDQLQVWCERAGATMVRANEGASPSGVGYDALKEAIRMQADYCLLDTAGRLHTKSNLMEELKKSKLVLTKLDPDAPHETLLVLDAITGQNALRQAEEFHQTLGLTGLIFTKCDGSSKAGSLVAIVEKLKVPITYIGVGEAVEDLNQFNLDDYLESLLGLESRTE